MDQRILIVDDSPSILKILNDALHDDYQISVTTSGRDALDVAAAQHPDLILLDIKMPDMDGYEVCRRLKQSPETCDIPILFVTVLNDTEDEAKGLELGAVDYITKPIAPAVVQARVRTHLRLKRHQDHLEELVRERTRELDEARARAEEANRAQGEFITNISHEIRTPMSSILGMTDLLLESEPTPRQREYLGTISESATQLMRLLNDLLDFSGFETGKIAMEKAPFEPHKIFLPLCLEFLAKAEKRGLSFFWKIDPRIPATLLGDAERLKQILAHLLDNALKFTPAGAIDLKCLRDDNGAPGSPVLLRFSLTDTGIGIPDEEREKIFEPFYQIDSSLSRRYAGTGIGLAMTRRLVEMMGGSIRAESVPAGGSRFTFTVPLERERDRAVATVLPAKNWRDLRVLVVEDNEANRRFFQILLESQKCFVRVAENGRKALDILEKEPFDLILIDIQMPEMDGLEATRRIRAATGEQWNPAVAIIALTAHGQVGDRQFYLDAGMNDYLAKPFRAQTLLDKIERLILNPPPTETGDVF
ncbi:response regulator [Trichloromonas sp.]|uniref:response regulator n=1 Tax=Trichloromonas sp. TaxID=3069249 RepID=UPI002A41B7A5|nr:response regulator [Trichloromonas sp.]